MDVGATRRRPRAVAHGGFNYLERVLKNLARDSRFEESPTNPLESDSYHVLDLAGAVPQSAPSPSNTTPTSSSGAACVRSDTPTVSSAPSAIPYSEASHAKMVAGTKPRKTLAR